MDISEDDWGMDPQMLKLAFEKYQDVRLVIAAHVYGVPSQIMRIKEICKEHDALLIEDASDSFGAKVCLGEKTWKMTGSIGDYGVLDFGRGKIITGEGGGMLLTEDFYSEQKARCWTEMANLHAHWERYREIGYHYEMNDMTAALIQSQFAHLEEHISKKKEIYKRYKENFCEDLLLMNPIGKDTQPNYWISCATTESDAFFYETRSEARYHYSSIHGVATPMEIVEALEAFLVESKPVLKPMHLQPLFFNNEHLTLDGGRRTYENFYDDLFWIRGDVSAEIFSTSICLPSDVRMTKDDQERIIEIIHACFNKKDMNRLAWI